MALDDDLEALNVRIRQLRTQFDLFFSGALPKPPLEARDLLEKEVKRIGTSREMKLAQRFLYNTLLNRWNIFSEFWNKKLQEREEGVRIPAIARRRGAGSEANGTEGARPDQGAADSRRGQAAAEKKLVARAAVVDGIDDSGESLREFYRSFLEARQEAGSGKAPSFEKFRQEIQRQARTIREKTSCDTVDFRLYLEDNKVALKAIPVKGKDPKENRS